MTNRQLACIAFVVVGVIVLAFVARSWALTEECLDMQGRFCGETDRDPVRCKDLYGWP